MGKITLLGVVALCLMFISSAFASEKVHNFDMGVESSYFIFKQSSDNVKEKGSLSGVFGTYTFKPQIENWLTKVVNVFKIDAHFVYGNPDYKSSGDSTGVKDYLFEPRLLLGKDFLLSRVTVTPYSGFGYRLFFRDGKTEDGFADDKYQYFYLPIGVSAEKEFENGWKIGGLLEYDFLLKGSYAQASSELSNSLNTVTDTKNMLNKGYGIRAAINFGKKVGKVDLTVSPYVHYWNIGKSNTTTYYVNGVPFLYQAGKSSAMELGLSLGMKF
ncbi:autotransporter outer membrane beta-barrel domain-containing protein [bacterium]|nr:autotransporter outer membrane beta-barrel domain-containing protein [bacterium]